MCGIFGIITGKNSAFPASLFESSANRLFKLSESRGKEASGLAINSLDNISIYKQPISASSLIHSEKYKEILKKAFSCNGAINHPVALIGHSRLVTQGGQEFHQNNQPVSTSGLVGIHNGIITNDKKLWQEFSSLKRQFEVDTEVLFSLIRMFYHKSGSLIEAVKRAFGHIQGVASIAVFFNDLNLMLLATNNGSLYYCRNKTGNICLFASERYILKMLLNRKKDLQRFLGGPDILPIDPGSGYLLDLDNISMERFYLNQEAESPFDINKREFPKQIIDLTPEKKSGSSVDKGQIKGPFILPTTFADQFPENQAAVACLKRCRKCVLPETMPFIEFDGQGVCNYCRNFKKMEIKGTAALEKEVSKYRRGPGDQDCLVAFSGGRDSSYALHYIKNVLKMNPVAYTYDWGMITDLARRNQSRICGQLGIEHILISADINWKRNNIRKNVTAWLKKPLLGTVPLFMAGDKQFFWYAYKLRRQLGIDLLFINMNPLEKTDFKAGYCNIKPESINKHHLYYRISFLNGLKLSTYYARQYLLNPSYLNSSVWDTMYAYASYYMINHDHLSLYRYLKWDENEVNEVLINGYDWEVAPDTKSTWRIGDGTTSFYNYIYYTVAGLTENDTFTSNQIREGTISRKEGLELANKNNEPRYESINWYCDTIGVNFSETIRIINSIPKRYPH